MKESNVNNIAQFCYEFKIDHFDTLSRPDKRFENILIGEEAQLLKNDWIMLVLTICDNMGAGS